MSTPTSFQKIERQAEAIEPGAEVGRRSGDACGELHGLTGRAPRRRPRGRRARSRVARRRRSPTPGPSTRGRSAHRRRWRLAGASVGGEVSSPATLAAPPARRTSPPARPPVRRRISRSVTARICPSDSVAAATALPQDAGFPIRMAVAIVCGSFTASPRTIGAAPCAWNPNSWGGSAITPSREVLPSTPSNGWRCCPRCRPARSGCRAPGRGSRRSRTQPSSVPPAGRG